ncbi:hypothetical protein CR532_04640 (plasmid) [Candidatus Borreliella tachyglossi]|uniref:DUF3890 domain-containing protein n=1 Tax=Candidatus Borreliella tachyglossi TaxID=1964448 RepID=A0A2S1LYA9_9SPIR|nr:DUF3890 domain-containing protein [Candidatus Borreliella tachyglossi]AWG43288.1 hypothetical protein CR532_04640 [Candidatus Borreliella tachyglossi]
MKNEVEPLDYIYSRILDLLVLKTEEFSIKDFNVYLGLLEDILLSYDIGLKDLNDGKVFLLIYYFLGCELKKRGKLTHFDFSRVKSERFNEISVEYSDYVLRDEARVKDFCIAFNDLLREISRGKNKGLIGVI